jgi:hypothetical protein
VATASGQSALTTLFALSRVAVQLVAQTTAETANWPYAATITLAPTVARLTTWNAITSNQ